MKERPILFSAPMVRAILAGTKTQTRRIVKPQPQWGCIDDAPELGNGRIWWPRGKKHERYNNPCDERDLARCMADSPSVYARPGDRLWVKETFRLRADQDEKKPSDDWWKSGAWYAADPGSEPSGCGGGAGKLRPSIFMPRWASRITLEVAGVRVEQLHDVSAADAVAEGVVDDSHGWDGNPTYPRARFRTLWQEINGDESWSANPWVWVVEFKRVEDVSQRVMGAVGRG